ELARQVRLGRHLTAPWKVVVAGAPNVGKSSLVNALAGYQRSIVSPIPGTTRDVVTTSIAIDGWPIDLIDTGSLSEQAEELEQQGIRLAESAVAEADLCLMVLDGAANELSSATGGLRPPLAQNMQLVINKIDLPPGWDWNQELEAVRVSALTEAGLGELCDCI